MFLNCSISGNTVCDSSGNPSEAASVARDKCTSLSGSANTRFAEQCLRYLRQRDQSLHAGTCARYRPLCRDERRRNHVRSQQLRFSQDPR